MDISALDKLLNRCNEMDITEQINWLGDANIPFIAKKELAALKSELATKDALLAECARVIALQSEVIRRWFVYEKCGGQEELEKEFGKIDYPDSSISCEDWLEIVLRIPTAEATGAATELAKKLEGMK